MRRRRLLTYRTRRREGYSRLYSLRAAIDDPIEGYPKYGLRWGEPLGPEECPYMRRWLISLPKIGSVRVHHWYRSDDKRWHHDHPWGFWTLVLRGSYTDVSEREDGTEVRERMTPGSFAHRPSLHRHTVAVDPGGCWTLIVTTPQTRKWGFWVDGVFEPVRSYFRKYGHHPCDQP